MGADVCSRYLKKILWPKSSTSTFEVGIETHCPVENVKCNPRLPIRSADGTCNNLQQPLWGSVHRPYSRLVPPAYEDGIKDPRGAVFTDSGYLTRLPSPRVVSTNLMLGSNATDAAHSHLLMQFGQFVDHDLSANSKGGKQEVNY